MPTEEVKPKQIYQVVRNTRLERFCDAVNALIAAGWTPQGGLAIDSGAEGIEYFQAMVHFR